MPQLYKTISKVFTGIIEEIGKVKSIQHGTKSVRLEIAAEKVMEGTLVGDSIATNGVCLTVTSLSRASKNGQGGTYTADVMPESVKRTSLAQLKPGSPVNLERALTLQSRLGGHIVSGHVDGTGTIINKEQDDNALWLWIECGADIMRYIIEKGSITIQGVSLTVAKVRESSFAVSLIPHTQDATTLHTAKVGDIVNLENDVIAKYVEKLIQVPSKDGTSSKGIDFYRNFMMSNNNGI